METNIEINIEEEKWIKDFPRAEEIIKSACIAALEASGITACAQNMEVSVLLANDKFIKGLNHEYRDKNKATNVLSFPLEDFNAGKYDDISGDIALGDIIFALETIKNEAIEQNKTLESHLAHLAVHGTLHLIGFDHENDADAEVMEALEIKVLAEIGIENPY